MTDRIQTGEAFRKAKQERYELEQRLKDLSRKKSDLAFQRQKQREGTWPAWVAQYEEVRQEVEHRIAMLSIQISDWARKSKADFPEPQTLTQSAITEIIHETCNALRRLHPDLQVRDWPAEDRAMFRRIRVLASDEESPLRTMYTKQDMIEYDGKLKEEHAREIQQLHHRIAALDQQVQRLQARRPPAHRVLEELWNSQHEVTEAWRRTLGQTHHIHLDAALRQRIQDALQGIEPEEPQL